MVSRRRNTRRNRNWSNEGIRKMKQHQQAADPAEGEYAVGRVFRDCPDCPDMIVVPPGHFDMGSPDSEAGRDNDEGPVHQVTVGYRFAVGVHEVTRGEFGRFVSATNRVMGNKCATWRNDRWRDESGTNWRHPGFSQTDDHPVVCVSWNDAKAYARWLSRETGQRYRLLSESEWEYVARAGSVGISLLGRQPGGPVPLRQWRRREHGFPPPGGL